MGGVVLCVAPLMHRISHPFLHRMDSFAYKEVIYCAFPIRQHFVLFKSRWKMSSIFPPFIYPRFKQFDSWKQSTFLMTVEFQNLSTVSVSIFYKRLTIPGNTSTLYSNFLGIVLRSGGVLLLLICFLLKHHRFHGL